MAATAKEYNGEQCRIIRYVMNQIELHPFITLSSTTLGACHDHAFLFSENTKSLLANIDA